MQAHTISGIHHITAIAADPQRNLDFYTSVLGLRLVKLTVNFDDPGTYHFYFGNASGTPGSILTFFPWPGARRGTVGTGQVTATTFAIPHGSVPFWRARLSSQAVAVTDAGERFGEPVIAIADPMDCRSNSSPPGAQSQNSRGPARRSIANTRSADFTARPSRKKDMNRRLDS